VQDIDREPTRKVHDAVNDVEYSIWEKLGEGAFGAV